MFGEPLLAHRAEIGGIHASWCQHSGDNHNRDQHDDDANGEQHMVFAVIRSSLSVEQSLHFCGRPSVRLCTTRRVRGPCVQSGTAPFSDGPYAWTMQLVSIKAVVAAVWVSAVSIVGIAGHLSSPSSLTVLASVALLPTIVMMWLWNDPPKSMSESIQDARR